LLYALWVSTAKIALQRLFCHRMQPNGSERTCLGARTTTYATSIDDFNQATLELSYRAHGASPHARRILALLARYCDVRRRLRSYHADARRFWVKISIVKTHTYEFARPAASAQLWVTVYVWYIITEPEIVGCA
jgi:hypothetical protein